MLVDAADDPKKAWLSLAASSVEVSLEVSRFVVSKEGLIFPSASHDSALERLGSNRLERSVLVRL